MVQEPSSGALVTRPYDVEIDDFLHMHAHCPAGNAVNSALEFRLMKAPSYPTLHKIAIDILCVPATSAAAERVFSQAGLCSSVLR